MLEILGFMKQHDVKSLLDIGANVGHFSTIVKANFPNMDLLMLEANPYCKGPLERTGLPFEIACLSDEFKEVTLYLNPLNYQCTGVSYYQENTHHYTDAHPHKMTTKLLDNIVGDKTYEYIKMDTQGSELDILRGGKKAVERAKYIQLELSLIEYNKGAPLKDEVVEYMATIGFKPTLLVENHYHEGNLIQEDWIFTR